MNYWKKTGLHAHPVLSDGKGKPEQMVSVFQAQGFDAVVWTTYNYFADGSSSAINAGELPTWI